jgi:hypothetical protein
MDRARRAGIALIALACSLVPPAAQAQKPRVDDNGVWHDAPPTEAMACRGPLDVRIGMNSSPPVTMTFARAQKPGSAGVEAGTCAWVNRRFIAHEPDCLQHYTKDIAVSISVPRRAAAEPFAPDLKVRPMPGGTASQMMRERGMVTQQATPAPAAPPAPTSAHVRLDSYTQAKYIEHIATTSEKVAYFRVFRAPDATCLYVERVGR